ncbi:MAG: acyl-CoA ligase (AMP-forming), exosortase A system-associated [Burkholderiales bacterium]|nr:acyl-CoA ligase (AMP-forming), exosortase A system-associated [Burkholderiales bacterium]
MARLLHELILEAAEAAGESTAITHQAQVLTYAALADAIRRCADAYAGLGLARSERIAIYLDKRFETVIAAFGAAQAGCVFVPINPLLKPAQVVYIMRDCNVRVLVTSAERLGLLAPALRECPDLRAVVVAGTHATQNPGAKPVHSWTELMSQARPGNAHRVIDIDMTAILYTSGSTGSPKGVVLSHRNMVAGAYSVAQYLRNRPEDRILSALPLSFDAGFSQLTTAFASRAQVVLINYLVARDVLLACERERITGLTAVPPLWIQLANLQWPETARTSLRYIANTGGHMPRQTLDALREHLPGTLVYLMYGLTEAFRSTYLPPEEVDRRPDSIGKAIPNAEIMVVREDGSPCRPGEAGELVHRGALVSLGYWNDPEKTAARFRPAPGQPAGLVMPEIAVWSGDTVRTDDQGFIYFVGRRDEMIKTSGYRVSPTEVEEAVYASGLVAEAVALGVPHPVLGQSIAVVATPLCGQAVDQEGLLRDLRERLPVYMVPARIVSYDGPLPRNPNGKIDRKGLLAWLDRPAAQSAMPAA